MKVNINQLAGQLKSRLAPAYVLSGDEPLQLMEGADAIRQAAGKAGFTHREIFFVGKDFDWSLFREAYDTSSLFGESRILDLRLTAKPDKAGAEALLRFSENPPMDALLMLSLPKVTAADQKVRWLAALERIGVLVQVWPLHGDQLLRWLDQRLNARGLLADQSGLRLLAARVEGNLLAAAQEIEKLHILYGHGQLTDQKIVQAVMDSSRFELFELSDQVLQGHAARACRILQGLRGEGIAAPLVLWALTREIRLINTLKVELAAGDSMESVFSKHRIWDNRKALISQALQRLSLPCIHKALLLSAEADRVIKGISPGDEWEALLSVCLYLTTPQSRKLHSFTH